MVLVLKTLSANMSWKLNSINHIVALFKVLCLVFNMRENNQMLTNGILFYIHFKQCYNSMAQEVFLYSIQRNMLIYPVIFNCDYCIEDKKLQQQFIEISCAGWLS